MTAEQFCYWLHGYMEIAEADHRGQPPGLTEQQRQVISDHLDLVFNKVTPDRSKKKVLNEKTAGERFQEVIDDLQRSRPGVTCDPFDPYPAGVGGKRIC